MARPVDYARIAFDVVDEFERLDSPAAVMDRMSTAFSVFGYTAFLITGLPEPPQRIEAFYLLNGWPDGWTEHYAREDYYKDDPVATWCRRTIDPYRWADTPYDPEHWPRAAKVMGEASEFGMKDGFCVPVVRANGFHAAVTMAGERPDFEPRAQRAIHLVSLYAHAKVLTLLEQPKAPGGERRPLLTHRECEVLRWTAVGKSSWDISAILGISESGVNKLVRSAVTKLDAVNRTQAVVNAIRAGEIRV